MELFCYHRGRPGSMALRETLLDEHLTYMDRYAAEMIAPGPTSPATATRPPAACPIRRMGEYLDGLLPLLDSFGGRGQQVRASPARRSRVDDLDIFRTSALRGMAA
jgi:hypothetical protein